MEKYTFRIFFRFWGKNSDFWKIIRFFEKFWISGKISDFGFLEKFQISEAISDFWKQFRFGILRNTLSQREFFEFQIFDEKIKF